MGFLARSVSLMRYRIKDEMEGSFWDSIHEGVRRGAFKEVEGGGDIVGFGWTSLDDFTDFAFEGASYHIGDYVALSMRVDTARVPAKALEIRFKAESRKLLEQTRQRRLSFQQTKELKDRLKEELQSQVLPSIQVFDLVWNTSERVAYFGSHSVKAREQVEDLFKKSFGLTIIPLIPYLVAGELLSDNTMKKRLEELRPSVMVP